MSNNKYTCWFCGKEVTDCEEGVEFTYEFDSFFCLDCLTEACSQIMPSEKNDYTNAETIMIMKEMNEKGYEFEIAEENED